MRELTFGMIKPDAVGNGDTGKILGHLERFINLRIVGLVMKTLSREEACALYSAHKDKHFFEALIQFTCSGPVVLMALEGADAINRYRLCVENYLRPEFGFDRRRNAVHGSDSVASAQSELQLFFPELS